MERRLDEGSASALMPIGKGTEAMKRMTAVIFVVFGLGGCVGQRMNDGLGDLVGQNHKVAVARLGYPDGQRTILGDTIYVWSASHNTVMPMTSTNFATGMVGRVPFSGATTNTDFVPVNLNCAIQLAVDQNGTIKSYQWSGNVGGCSPYANALRAAQSAPLGTTSSSKNFGGEDWKRATTLCRERAHEVSKSGNQSFPNSFNSCMVEQGF
jgi:hypothetical protein